VKPRFAEDKQECRAVGKARFVYSTVGTKYPICKKCKHFLQACRKNRHAEAATVGGAVKKSKQKTERVELYEKKNCCSKLEDEQDT
jgi:hypothetical protein